MAGWRWLGMNQMMLSGIALLLFGLIVTPIAGPKALEQAQLVETQGQPRPATISGKLEEWNRGKRTTILYDLTVEGRTVTLRRGVDQERFDRYEIGQPITLTAAPDRPFIHDLYPGELRERVFMSFAFPLGIGILGLVLIALGWRFRASL